MKPETIAKFAEIHESSLREMGRFPTPWRVGGKPYKGEMLDHALWLVLKVRKEVDARHIDRACRWLGVAEGMMISAGVYTQDKLEQNDDNTETKDHLFATIGRLQTEIRTLQASKSMSDGVKGDFEKLVREKNRLTKLVDVGQNEVAALLESIGRFKRKLTESLAALQSCRDTLKEEVECLEGHQSMSLLDKLPRLNKVVAQEDAIRSVAIWVDKNFGPNY